MSQGATLRGAFDALLKKVANRAPAAPRPCGTGDGIVQTLPSRSGLRQGASCAVLLIDRSRSARLALGEVLRESGFSVWDDRSLSTVEHHGSLLDRPCLALVDFAARDGAGADVATRLRRRWPDIFVVFMSDCSPIDDSVLADALSAPHTTWIVKPMSLDITVELVKRACSCHVGPSRGG